MCACFKLTPTFVADGDFDDEMTPHVITHLTNLRLTGNSDPDDDINRLKREFVLILDSIDLKATYKSLHKPQRNINDAFIKTIY